MKSVCGMKLDKRKDNDGGGGGKLQLFTPDVICSQKIRTWDPSRDNPLLQQSPYNFTCLLRTAAALREPRNLTYVNPFNMVYFLNSVRYLTSSLNQIRFEFSNLPMIFVYFLFLLISFNLFIYLLSWLYFNRLYMNIFQLS